MRDLEKVWISDVQANLKDAFLVLVGNKADVDDELRTKSSRQVTQEEATEFKEKHKIHHCTEVSAKTGKGIKELVEHIAKNLYHINKDTVLKKDPSGSDKGSWGAASGGSNKRQGNASFQKSFLESQWNNLGGSSSLGPGNMQGLKRVPK